MKPIGLVLREPLSANVSCATTLLMQSTPSDSMTLLSGMNVVVITTL